MLWTSLRKYATNDPDVVGNDQANNPCYKFKNEHPGNDAITDNVAGQAYVEQFALEVFSRAENAMRANKVTKYV